MVNETILAIIIAFAIGTAAAVVVLLGFLYMLFRPDPYKNQKKASRRSVAA